MSKSYQKFRKSVEFLSAISGGLLITLPVIPQPAKAQQLIAQVNPCPRIFYEEPHNSRVIVPQGCPPNAFTQQQEAQGLIPASSVPAPGTVQPGSVPPSEGQIPPGAPAPTIQPGSVPPSEGQIPPGAPAPGVLPPRPVPPSVTPTQGQGSPVPPAPEQRQAPSATISLANGRVNIKLVNKTAANVTYQVIGDTAPRSLKGKSDVILQSLSAPLTVTFQRDDGGQLMVTPQPSSEAGSLEVTFNEATDAAQGRSAMRIEPNGSLFLN